MWIEHAGERLSMLEVIDAQVRLCGAALRCAGIANVFTPPGLRGRGYARRLMQEALERLRDQGYLVAGLFGIQDFYDKYGFATVAPDFIISVPTHLLACQAGGLAVRPARPADLPHIAGIYNRVNHNVDYSLVRDPAAWAGPRRGSQGPRRALVMVAVGADDKPLGYLLYDDETEGFAVSDAGYLEIEAVSGLLRAAARIAASRGAPTMDFKLHPEVGLGAYLRRMFVIIESSRPDNHESMLRLLDQDRVLQAVTPVLARRARGWDGAPVGRLRLTTELGSTRARLGDHPAEIAVHMPHPRLAQLLFGYWSAGEIAETERLTLPSEHVRFLELLFPRHDGYCYWPDRY